MTDDRDNPLLVAVEELTKPQRSKVMQEAVLRTVELPPLLIQLRDAIAGSIGIGGSGSLANERNMLDGDALYRFSLISSTIGDWARMAGSTAAKNDPVATLQSWYVAYTQSPSNSTPKGSTSASCVHGQDRSAPNSTPRAAKTYPMPARSVRHRLGGGKDRSTRAP
jgi:hypothetical protein